MAISFVGSAKGTNTATAPAHQAGDLMLVCATRNASATKPTLPSGWIQIGAGLTTNTNAMIAGYKIATGTSDATGTWTNATETIVHIYRPGSGNTCGIGRFAFTSGSSATVSYTGFTQADASGNSWVARFGETKTQNVGLNNTMTGFTQRQDELGTGELISFDTNAGVSTNSTATQAITSGVWKTFSVEILLLSQASIPSQVVQWKDFGTSPNSNNNAYTGNTFTLPIDNALGTANCLVLFFTNDNGLTLTTVSDSVNGAWTSLASITTASEQDCHCYYFPNSGSGASTITVTFSAATQSFDAKFYELQGIATSSTSAGTSSGTSAQAGQALTAGSFTPTNNNATGGNIVLAYFSKCQAVAASTHHPSQIVAGANFTLLAANQADGAVNGSNSATAVEAWIQTTSAAVNPALTVVNDTDTYNSLAIALKLSAGTGTGPSATIHPETLQQYTTSVWPTAGTYAIQVVAQGATRLFGSDDPALNALTVTDSEGNTWTGTASGVGIWYLLNASPNANLTIFVTGGGTDSKLSWRYCDTTNAATFDSSIAVTDTISASTTTLTTANKPSPSNTNGMVWANIGLGQGPGLACTAPSGATWMMPNYTGETDQDWMGNADMSAWYHNTASGSETWTFTITSQAASMSDSGGYIALKASVAAATNPFQVYDLSAGLVLSPLPRLNQGHFASTMVQLIGQDQLPGVSPGQVPDYDYPPWFALRPAVSLRTHLDPSRIHTIGLDQIYGAPGQAPVYPQPNPTPGKADNNVNRGWLYTILTNTLSIVTIPFNMFDWPNPLRAVFRMQDHSARTSMAGQDQMYGASGQVPVYDTSNPVLRKPDVGIRSWLQNLLQYTLSIVALPFALFDWPNPRGPKTDGSVNRTHLDPTKQQLIGLDALYGGQGQVPNYDMTNPRLAVFRMQDHSARTSMAGQDQLYGVPGQVQFFDTSNPVRRKDNPDLRSWIGNLLQNTLSIIIFPFAMFDWPNPRGPKSDGNINRTHLDPTKRQLIGLDRIYGGPGQAPTYEHSVANPVRRKDNPDLRSWLVNLLQNTGTIILNPFVQTEWPNPLKYLQRIKAWSRVAEDSQQLGPTRPLPKLAQPPVMSPVPHSVKQPSYESWITQIARNANLMLGGKMNATARVVLNPGQDNTVLNDSRIGPFSHFQLSPLSASAADVLSSGLVWFESSQGSVTIHHPVMGYFDASCSVLIIG